MCNKVATSKWSVHSRSLLNIKYVPAADYRKSKYCLEVSPRDQKWGKFFVLIFQAIIHRISLPKPERFGELQEEKSSVKQDSAVSLPAILLSRAEAFNVPHSSKPKKRYAQSTSDDVTIWCREDMQSDQTLIDVRTPLKKNLFCPFQKFLFVRSQDKSKVSFSGCIMI